MRTVSEHRTFTLHTHTYTLTHKEVVELVQCFLCVCATTSFALRFEMNFGLSNLTQPITTTGHFSIGANKKKEKKKHEPKVEISGGYVSVP